MSSIIKNLEILLRPTFWLRNHPTCKYLDYTINALLDDGHTPRKTSEYTVELGGLNLWVSNYPYAFGNEYPGDKALPSRKTALRLYRALSTAPIEKKPHLKKVLESNGIF